MATQSSDDRPKIFIAQSGPHVEMYLEELEDYLKLFFRVWHDRKQSGSPPDPIIRKHLEDCGGAVLLVDIKFLTSDYIRDIEVPTLWTRFAPEDIAVIGVAAGDVAGLVELHSYTDPRSDADPREFLLSDFDWVPRGYTSNDKRHHRATPLSQLERGDRESYYAEIVTSFRRFFDEQPASAPPPPPPDAVDTLQARLGRASSALLGWKQTIEKQWLERPEFDQIVKRITGSEYSTTLLLGRPGSGKSALLAKLGHEFQNLDTSVLAIKADLLSADVCTPAALATELELPSDTVAVIRKIANAGHRCLVLLDQLDVLAGFVEKRPERLTVLTGLLTALSGVPGVHVVASCREFEHRYDTRLQNLSDEPIRLELLTRDQVTELLAKTSKLPLSYDAPAFDLLRTPHNLRLVVENLDQLDQLAQADTSQALVSLIVEAQLDRAGLDGALDLAVDMGAREELFVDQAKIDTDTVTPMLKAGLLEPIGGRLVFVHQTLFEYFWGRAATRDGLVALMRDSSQTTYVRLRLRVALRYLHAADLHRFYDELDQLWSDPNFVKHLRRLVVVFVASLDAPTELDARWIEQRIRELDWGGTALRRLRSTRWFSPLRDTLDMVMAGPDPSAEATISLLAAAADDHGVEVVDLLRKHWLRPARIGAAIRVGRSFSTMTADVLDLWLELVRFEACEWVELIGLVRKYPAHRRHVGLLVAAFVSARLTRMIIEHGPNLEGNHGWHSPLREALESLEIYDAGSMLSGSERVFVDRLWQPLEAVITLMGDTGRAHFDRLDRRSYDLVKVVRAAIRIFASKETNAFATFLRDRGQTKNVTMQWFLFAGLNAIAENHPDVVIEHLVTDPARLRVGADEFKPWGSHDLIAKILTVANTEQLARLERAILDIPPPALDPEQAAKLEVASWWAQQHANLKSWLLELLPEDTRSPAASEWLETLDEDPQRKERSHERPRVQAAQCIDSPVKSPELDDMANEDIVALFQKYSDDTGWSDPGGDWSVGGSIQLSRELAKTLAKDPKRAEALFAGFEPGVQERPIGETLQTWAQDEQRSKDEKRELILRWVQWAELRGFSSQEFRVDAASALQRISEPSGLDDALCDMLRSWLRAWPRPEQADGPDPNEDDDGDVDPTKPVINYDGGGIIPSGAFRLIEALLIGLLCREPADHQQALTAVEEFWWALEEPRAYSIFGRRLMPNITYISDDNKMRMLRLLERDPKRLLRSDTLASLLRLKSTMPEAATAYRGLVEFVRDSGWAQGLQAYAELVAFSALWFELPWATAIVEELTTDVQPEALIAGVLHVATQTLEDPDTEPDKISVCIRWLVTSLPTLPLSLAGLWLRPLARSRWHRDKRPVEVLRPLFEAAALRPALLSHASAEILWIAAQLVDTGPSHVHAFTRAFLSGVKQRGSRLVMRDENADALITIIATLQRRRGHYQHGLELVDLLIEIDPWELDSLLSNLERT